MNDEIIKLARDSGLTCYGASQQSGGSHSWHAYTPHLEVFYRAAYNKAIEDAAKQCEFWVGRYSNTVTTNDGHWLGRRDADECAAAIRALELK